MIALRVFTRKFLVQLASLAMNSTRVHDASTRTECGLKVRRSWIKVTEACGVLKNLEIKLKN